MTTFATGQCPDSLLAMVSDKPPSRANPACRESVFHFMISPIEESDHVAIRRVLAEAIRETVAETENEAGNLIADVERSLAKWEQTKAESHHLKHVQDGVVTGFVIVKEYWNLSHLFVLPGYQRQGIGRQLISATLEACRASSPRGHVALNSSQNAVTFYEAMGFQKTGAANEPTSGYVPFEYMFELL